MTDPSSDEDGVGEGKAMKKLTNPKTGKNIEGVPPGPNMAYGRIHIGHLDDQQNCPCPQCGEPATYLIMRGGNPGAMCGDCQKKRYEKDEGPPLW